MDTFQDLELILDTNVERASTSSFQFLTPLPLASPETVEEGFPCMQQDVTTRVNDANQFEHSRALHGVARPVPAAASLTLAMGSFLSLNSIMQPPSHAHKLGFGMPKKIVAKPADSSARKALNPNPVAGSSKLDVSMGASEVPQIMKNKAASYISPFPDYQRLKDGQFGEPKNSAGLRRATIVWFRNDLRVHDNEALVNASNESVSVLPVYCFDPRDYGKSSSGFDKTGPYRAKFLLECVANLRENLREKGSDLVIRIGKPEEVLVTLAKSVGADALYAHQEVAHEEMNAEEKVSAALKEEGVACKYFWGSTLYHIDDLPFKLEEMPSNYGGFRDKVRGLEVRSTIVAPKNLKGLPIRGNVKVGEIPSLQELGLNPTSAKRPEKHTAYGGALLVGGEEEALQRLKSFSVEASSLSNSKSSEGKKSGDSIYGANFSCKISPWLAMGCLSPRRMFEDLKQSTKRVVSSPVAKSSGPVVEDDGLSWLIFELLWRDFFRFITKKFGDGKRGSETNLTTGSTGVLATA